MSVLWGVIQVCSTPLCMVQCTHLITTDGTPHLYNRGSSMQQTLKLIVFFVVNNTLVLVAKSFDDQLKKNIFDFELVEWALIYRYLYLHRWMGWGGGGVGCGGWWWGWVSPADNTDRGKQPISSVRTSGGLPGNVIFWIIIKFGIQKACWSHQVERENNVFQDKHQLKDTIWLANFVVKRVFIGWHKVPG